MSRSGATTRRAALPAAALLVALAATTLAAPTAPPASVRTGGAPSARPSPVVSAGPMSATGFPTGLPARWNPTPTPTPTATRRPADVLERNPVYTVSVRGSCPPQREPVDEAAFQAQVRALVACLDVAWARALQPTEVEFRAPSVALFGESLLTVCGLLGVEFPALYCPLDSTLYFSAEAWRESSYYRLATAELALHEYAHHVQRLAGIYDVLLAASDTVRGLQRRVELQAHCLAMYELASSDIGLSASDVSDLEYQFAWPGDVEGHGSARAKTRWGRRGLGATTAGACNTWTASGDEVR